MVKFLRSFIFGTILLTTSYAVSHAQAVVSITDQRAACNSLFNGSFTVEVTSGVAPYSLFVFGISFGQSVSSPLTQGVPFNVTGLRPDNYIVVVSDGDFVNPNFSTFVVINNVVSALSVSVDPGFPVNNGDCALPTGQINVTASGGTGSYSYAWTATNGFTSSSEDITGLAGGAYSLVVSDNGTNCTTSIGPISLTDPSPAVQTITTTTPQVVCAGSDVTITLGDTEPAPVTYEILVNGAPSGVTQAGTGAAINMTLPSGAFSNGDLLTMRATNGLCTPSNMTGGVTVNIQTLSITNTVTNNTRCIGPFNGAIDITLAGTTNPVTYTWTGPSGFTAATEDITAVQDGAYSVTAQDNVTGCQTTANIVVGNATPVIVLSSTVTNNSRCVGPFNGAIDLTVAGSLGVPTFSWTGPGGFTAATEDIGLLEDGSYTVLVTDPTSGCTATTNIIVGDVTPVITLTSAVTDNSRCVLPFNGAINLTVAGSLGIPTFSWTGPGGFTAASEDINALVDGSYTVVVTDPTSGCTATTNIVVGNIAPVLTVTPVIVNNTRCVAPFNGAIDITVGGSAGPFTYSWTGPGGFTSALEDVTTLQPGNYAITVTDTNSGCTITSNIVVADTPPALTVSGTITNNTRCIAPFNGAIDIAIAGSAGPFTFSWTGPGGFTAATEDVTALAVGAYAVTVTDTPSGCTSTGNFTVTDAVPTITITNVVTDNTRCIAPFNGAIDITVAGSAGPYTYSWTGPGGFTANTEDVSVLQNGSYSVTVTDTPTGCSVTSAINVGNAVPTLSITSAVTNNTRCVAPFDGAIDMTVAGSAGPFTFAWTGPGGFSAATEDITALQSGSYNVTVTDVPSGCTTSTSINVGNTTPTLSVTSVVTNNTRCIAPFDGAIDITIGGSAGPFTFAWTGPGGFTASTEDISVLINGSYNVIVTDIPSGCSTGSTINVGNAAPTLSITSTVTNNTRCVAPFDGAINITVAGSAGPFTFAWTGPGGFTASTEDITVLQNGSYNVTVTDTPSGCTTSSSINVGNSAPTLSVTNTVTNNTRCLAPFDGAINITVAGSAGPFTFAWTGPGGYTALTEDISALQAGAYSVTITDTPSGCTTSSIINVIDALPVLTLTNLVTNTTRCVAPFDGAIDITVGGSAGPFSYAWTGPGGFTAVTEDISAADAGAYSVTVTDTNSGCTTTANINIANNAPVLALTNVVTNNTSCRLPFNGAIDLSVSGSAGPFTFAWTGPGGFTALTEDITALNGGTYTITVTDVTSGCQSIANIDVLNSTAAVVITTDAIVDNSSCVAFNGAISVSISGSAGPFTYAWTGPGGFTAATEDITNLVDGSYSLTVTDNVNGCFSSANFTVNNIAPTLSITNTITDNNRCVAPFGGSVDIAVAGSAGPFTFAWTGPGGFTAATEDINAVQDGAYSVTVTDNASGCTVSGNFTINNTAPTLSLSNTTVNNTRCTAPFTGSIDITISGSAGPFTYAWTGPGGFTSSTEDLTNVQDGSYDVTVTDTNTGCQVTSTIVVGLTTSPFAVTGSITDNTKCIAPFNGAIILTVAPVGSYAFAWTGPGGFTSNSKNVTALSSGLYQVVVTDLVTGCTDTQNFTVNDNVPAITITVDTNSPNTSCIAPFDGVLLISASGGSGAYSFAWTGPNGFASTLEDIANIENGDYTVVVTDINLGCTATATLTVIDATPTVLLASQTITDNTKCQAPFDGAITVTGGGTPGPYTFDWVGPNGFTGSGASIANLESGNYTVTITDQTIGCSDSYALVVGNNAPPVTITIDSTTPNTQCIVPFTGAIQITVSGTPGPFNFSWSGPNGFTANVEDITQLEDGDYAVTAIDAILGCSATVSTITVANNRPVITVTQQSVTPNTSCQAPFDGAITVTAAGTAGPYNFDWTGPNGFTGTGATISGLESGDYTVTATDQVLGCTGTLVINIPDNTPTISVVTTINPNTKCVGPFDGSIDITATAGTAGPFTYSWVGPNGFTSATMNITGLEPGDYDVTITDTNLGCNDTYRFSVPDAAPVIAVLSNITPNSSCKLPFDGAIDITVSGTAGPFTFAWTGPNSFTSATEDISLLEAGNYDVLVTDTNLGCSASFSLNVPDNSIPVSITLNGITANTSCTSPFNGTIDITAGGTPGPFTISWTGPGGFTSSLPVIGGLAPGIYTVTVTDDVLGCFASSSFTVNNNAIGCGGLNCGAFTVTAVDIRPSCANQDDGQIAFTVTGGSPNYIFTLTNTLGFAQALPGSGPTFTFTNLSPANYTYTIQDAVGNICSLPYSLPLQTIVDATAVPSSFVDVACFGEPVGQAIINATGSQTGQYFYSIDGLSWTLFTPGNVISDLPPNGTYSILVGESIGDACRDTVNVTINNINPVIAATFTITPATCSGNDGAITNIAASGGSGGPYDFSIDGGLTFQSFTAFSNLSGGAYTLLVRDGSGCINDIPFNITFPGFVNFTLFTQSADCTNNGLSGSISVDITDVGVFRVALSTDQFNEPADASYQDYNEPFVTFGSLPRGQYFLYVKSNAAACPTRSAPIDINGVYAIDFDVTTQCAVDKPSLVVNGITGEPGVPITIEVYKKFTNTLVESVTLAEIPVTSSFTFDFDSYVFMQTPDDYQVRIIQVQSTVFCLLTSSLVDYTVPRRLTAGIGTLEESYPDIATGTMQVINFDGGISPYEIRIELDSASSFELSFYETDFEEVTLNNNQQYEKKYKNIPAGRYKVQVTDQLGCSIELIARVPLDTDIFIPNIFTPNDDTVNDTFYIRNLPSNGNKLVITNRWGKEVFSSNDYTNTNAWNGGGVSDGVYYYNLQVRDSNTAITGWVEIMRGQKP